VIDEHGDFINREEYYPYGDTSFGGFAKKRYRFSGKERDEESGMYYHGARYYAPWILKWLSCDPLWSWPKPFTISNYDTNNKLLRPSVLYVYAKDNPISFIDPTGLEDESAGVAEAQSVRGFQLAAIRSTFAEAAPYAEAAASLNPLISTVEAVKGESSITKTKLAWWERLLSLPITPHLAGVLMGWSERVAKFGYRGLKVTGSMQELARVFPFEAQVARNLEKHGDVLLGIGDEAVAKMLSIDTKIKGNKPADLLTLTSSKFNIIEVKNARGSTGADIGDVLKKFETVIDHLMDKVEGAKIGRLEIAVPEAAVLANTYSVEGNQLVRITQEGREVVRVKGYVVRVRSFPDD
jgi:RHS repeat-associated protein